MTDPQRMIWAATFAAAYVAEARSLGRGGNDIAGRAANMASDAIRTLRCEYDDHISLDPDCVEMNYDAARDYKEFIRE